MQALRGRVAPEFRHVSGSGGREIEAARHAVTVSPSIPGRAESSSKEGQRSSLSILLRSAVADLGSAAFHGIRSYLMNHVSGVFICDVLVRESKLPFAQPPNDHF